MTAEAEGGFSPFASVRYTLWVTAESATISLARAFPGENGKERRVGLVSEAVLARAVAALEGCEVERLRSVRGSPGGRPRQVWRFTVYRDGEAHTFEVADPHLQADRRYNRCLTALREAAKAALEPMPFRDTFFAPGEFGFLQVASTPPARVVIDGDDLERESPMHGIRLKVGEHEVRFVDEERGIDRRYTVKILDGVTTNLDVDLR